MSGFNTKEVNNNGDYEITFYTENRDDFKKVQSLCRELIGNGKPISTKGDLISREWLKDAFDNLCCHDCKKCRNFRIEDSFYKCNLIDNAPTVERLQGDLISREYVKLFVCEYEKFNGKETEIVKAVPIIAIENAPTVELTEEQAIDKLHETGWLIRHDKEMTERPHIIDNCDMNVFEPEKYMEGGAE